MKFLTPTLALAGALLLLPFASPAGAVTVTTLADRMSASVWELSDR